MNQKSAVEARDKAKNIYRNGIVVFVVIFTTISLCLWFLSAINF
ncbi:MAG: hypothetical protein WCK68_08375 [Betaproteobacteria bacterium]|jgi:hypothetical protein